jgi:hypothetical protein
MKYLKKWILFENKYNEENAKILALLDYLNVEEIQNNFLDINDIMIDWIDKDIDLEYKLISNPEKPHTFILGEFKDDKFNFNIYPDNWGKYYKDLIIECLEEKDFYYKIVFGYEPHIINDINHDNPPEKYGLLLKECYLETSKRLESVFNIELLKTKVFDIREGRYYNLNERILNDHKFNLKYEITFKIN